MAGIRAPCQCFWISLFGQLLSLCFWCAGSWCCAGSNDKATYELWLLVLSGELSRLRVVNQDGISDVSLSLILACFWVLASALVAALPMRKQYVPGVALLIAAPALIGVIFYEHGALLGFAALFGFVSMFRRPLMYFGRKALGLPVERHEPESDT